MAGISKKALLIWLSWGAWSYSCEGQFLRAAVGTELSPCHSLLSVASIWWQLTDTTSTALVLRSSNQRNEKNLRQMSRATRQWMAHQRHLSFSL